MYGDRGRRYKRGFLLQVLGSLLGNRGGEKDFFKVVPKLYGTIVSKGRGDGVSQ